MEHRLTRPELLTLHAQLCAEGRDLMQRKNADYAPGTEDCFANFRHSAIFDVEPEIGLLNRALDKFMRIKGFVRSGTLAVKEESVTDALIDVINYMVLLAGMIEEQKPVAGRRNLTPEAPESLEDFVERQTLAEEAAIRYQRAYLTLRNEFIDNLMRGNTVQIFHLRVVGCGSEYRLFLPNGDFMDFATPGEAVDAAVCRDAKRLGWEIVGL